MILITGARGQLGKSTIDFLLNKIPAGKIAALARDEKKAAGLKAKGIDVRIGNYEDRDSLGTRAGNTPGSKCPEGANYLFSPYGITIHLAKPR